eukprot:gb/GFBE01080466.1/.p1 GENE.gb/GFBE01080466.1/~~gb/GFBE01080466.1/.p1  ORF type:complete len:929 (+),score=301.78 gb/GFBE01080466.1/:1-2787(+)
MSRHDLPSESDGGRLPFVHSTTNSSMSVSPTRSSAGRGGGGGGGANAWHEVLELCKRGFAGKMEKMGEELRMEIRSEVKLAAETMRREASDITTQRDRQVYNKLSQVFEKMMQIEKHIHGIPEPTDMELVFDKIKRSEKTVLEGGNQIGARVDKGVEAMSKHIDSSVESLMKRLEEQVSRLETHSERSEAKLAGEVMQMQSQLSGTAASLTGEMQKVQQQDNAHYTSLGRACDDLNLKLIDGLKKVGDDISDKIVQSEIALEAVLQHVGNQIKGLEDKVQRTELKLTSDVSNVQALLNGSATDIVNEIRKMQQQDDKHYTDFGFSLDARLAEQASDMMGLKDVVSNFDFEPVNTNIVKTRKQVNQDLRIIMGEIARVQQALHIDFVQMSPSILEPDPPGGKTGKVLSRGKTKKLKDLVDDVTASVDGDSLCAVSRTRVREFFTQTQPPALRDASIMTDPMADQPVEKKKKKKDKKEQKGDEEEGPKKAAFAGADKLKEKAKAASMKPPYNVCDYYYEKGVIQRIARSAIFDNLTLFVVFVNAVWIAVDTDLNPATVLVDAALPFQIAENFFCGYFFIELCIRFFAFERKINAFKDAWFVFDLALVSIMVAETWVVTIIVIAMDLDTGASNGNNSMNVLRMFRLVKLLRLSRVARVLRAVPELVIIMKGLGFAARSVSIFFLLWTVIIYVFAVAFRQLTEGMTIGQSLFPSVPHAMNTLLLHGVFADSEGIIRQITDEYIAFWPLIVFFFALVSVTIMYMLVGVLVDVVGLVATVEKEGIEVSYIAQLLRNQLDNLGYKPDAPISQYEFQNIMMEPSIVKIVAGAGVDVVVLADMMDLITEDINLKGGELSFPDLVDMVLSMRGSNPATVKDFKEQIKMIKLIVNDAFEEVLKKLRKQLNDVKSQIQESAFGEDGDDDEDGQDGEEDSQ